MNIPPPPINALAMALFLSDCQKHENARLHMVAHKTWKTYGSGHCVDSLASQVTRDEIQHHKEEVRPNRDYLSCPIFIWARTSIWTEHLEVTEQNRHLAYECCLVHEVMTKMLPALDDIRKRLGEVNMIGITLLSTLERFPELQGESFVH